MKPGDNGARACGRGSDATTRLLRDAIHRRRNRKRRDLDACVATSGEPLKLRDDRQTVEHLITVRKANQRANFRTAHSVYKARRAMLPAATTDPITLVKHRRTEHLRA